MDVAEWIAGLRQLAGPSGQGWTVLRGVVIDYADIRSRPDDDVLLSYIRERLNAPTT